jgi:RNase P subunit RPR2
MPEIEIKIKVNICSRCYHLWERRKGVGDGDNQPMVCPNCNSPYWNSMPKRARAKSGKTPLIFHGEEVLDSNFDEIFDK